ncbi:sulfotransferase family protein [Oceanicoccus sagamiensis]|uniref:Sulfotransferase n=1 Tax=Oceanicoccus sagamiensis TaxID=716816 RepID=A0A1X9NDX8_9GAMM|nr:sulfotransferase [Oceanicoccus sagamiensis]ARN74095.1 hypothetical protein BST96_08145 [Oceanicoccus sagamiensis]
MIHDNLIFVNYQSRSGSTFLCRLLDEYDDIAVGIESGFPGFPFRVLPTLDDPILDEASLSAYLDELFDDVRFKEWGLDKNTTFKALSGKGYPLVFSDIFTYCFDKYFAGNTSSFRIHKSGFYTFCLDEVRKQFPQSKHIYIQRDPRGIFSSIKEADFLYDKKKGNIISFINGYKKRTRVINDNLGEKDFLLLRYEDLIDNQEKVITSVVDFIGLKNKSKSEDTSYFEKIPENQRHLHNNVKGRSSTKSLDKWSTRLSYSEQAAINTFLKKELSVFNYPTLKPQGFKPADSYNSIILWFHFYLSKLKTSTTKRSTP